MAVFKLGRRGSSSGLELHSSVSIKWRQEAAGGRWHRHPALGYSNGKQGCGKAVSRAPGTPPDLGITKSLRLERISEIIEPSRSPSTALTNPCPQVPHPHEDTRGPSFGQSPSVLSSRTSPSQLLQTPGPFQSSSTLLSYCQLFSGKIHLIYLFLWKEMEQNPEQL